MGRINSSIIIVSVIVKQLAAKIHESVSIITVVDVEFRGFIIRIWNYSHRHHHHNESK